MTVINANIVHESEAQRQHARVRLPATLKLKDSKDTIKVLELSASGLSLEKGNLTLSAGKMESGLLQFNMDGLLIGLQVKLQVKNIDAANGRIGCVFQEIGQQEVNTLRQMITSYLAGELVTAGDIISILQRDNFTKGRKKGAGTGGEGFYGKARALAGSTFVFALGLTAFSFVGSTLYNLYFVTKAKSAYVDVSSINVTMPREGTLQSLVPADGRVVKGAPIASFSSSMLEVLKGHLDADAMQGEQIERLIGTTLKGTLTSPCDCTVAQQLVADGQVATKGENVFLLVPVDQQPVIKARFEYSKFADLQPGKVVTLTIAGDATSQSGKIRSISISDDHQDEVVVDIETDTKLTATFAHRPVQVNIGTPISIQLFDRIHATTRPEA